MIIMAVVDVVMMMIYDPDPIPQIRPSLEPDSNFS